MREVVDRIRRELQQRLESTRAAAQEHERVRAALEALEHAIKPLEKVTRRAAGAASQRARGSARSADATASAGSGAGAGPAVRSPATSGGRAGGPRKPSSGSRGGRKAASASTAGTGAAAKRPPRAARGTAGRARAPRGANREAVLAVVRERPGVSAGELAAASGVSGGTLYALLRRLTEQGELAKRELPGGQTGYVLAAGDDAAATGAGSDGAAREEAPATAATVAGGGRRASGRAGPTGTGTAAESSE